METHKQRQRVAGEVSATIARAHFKQSQVADEIKMARSTMSRKLSGKATFTVDDLLKIADCLNVGLNEFVPKELNR